MENKNDHKSKILSKLEDSTSGLTITELSKKVKFHRNTVSKYLNVLEAEGLVKKKEIGKALLYLSTKRKYLRRKLVNSFVKALLYGLKTNFPHNKEVFKNVGRNLLEYFQFSLGDAYLQEFVKRKENSNSDAYLELFKEFYNAFDFFQDDLDISFVELTPHRVVYRIKNSEFLENTDDFIYYFYIVCGITEGIYLRGLEIKINCNVENIHISNKRRESFVDISLEIQ
ncbi:MAG: winged helix-turn-helix domain-containing protein [Promethearchaeota archaeon]